jgi:hypothetical protein
MGRLLGGTRRIAAISVFLVGFLLAPGPRLAHAGSADAAGDAPAAESLDGPSGPSTVAKVVDAAVLRPLGALSVVAGVGFFIASLPISIAAEQVGTAREVLIDVPYEDTFNHPLGAI